MAYEVRETQGGFIIVGAAGAMLKDGGAGVNGEPTMFRDRPYAEARAAWLNSPARDMMASRATKRAARAEIAARFGIPAKAINGLMN